MSHHHEEIICPNCGYHAIENYCARCGQETHLHKETFWGLVVHFLGHYFHYDSKFWQTMKVLWFSPGKLTLAYWNKQRMRYISPISLYIFISAVYFLIGFSLPSDDIKVDNHPHKMDIGFSDDMNNNGTITFTDDTDAKADSATQKLAGAAHDSSGIVEWVNKKFAVLKKKHENTGAFINESLNHNLPKLFFFMIPVMALFLKILYLKRKDLFFVDHAIFALHFHSFWFSVFTLKFLDFSKHDHGLVTLVLSVIAMIYMIMALRRVYGSGRGKAIFYTLSIAAGYSIVLGILFLLSLVLILITA